MNTKAIIDLFLNTFNRNLWNESKLTLWKTVWKLKYFSSAVTVGTYYEVRQQSYA